MEPQRAGSAYPIKHPAQGRDLNRAEGDLVTKRGGVLLAFGAMELEITLGSLRFGMWGCVRMLRQMQGSQARDVALCWDTSRSDHELPHIP